MTNKELYREFGHIDPEMIEAASHTEGAKKTKVWLKWGSIAACLMVILLSVAIMLPLTLGGDDPIPPIVNGEEKKYYDYGINEGAFTAYIGGNIISEDKIGEKIEAVAVTAGWKNEEGKWVTSETLGAEVYAIEGVASNVAAALKFIEQGEVISVGKYYVIMHPNAEYNGMLFPDYLQENPVRYFGESDMGKCDGWQDFGANGEIRTIAVPVGSTYIYQMYAYYIRNDLTRIYSETELPDTPEDLPIWLSDTLTVGRRNFWYSMGGRIPENITLMGTTSLASEDGSMRFIQADYRIKLKDGSDEKEENWVVYFMEEDGVYSAYAVVANENFDFVKSYSEKIVKSYRQTS